jgi:hypothetical protein
MVLAAGVWADSGTDHCYASGVHKNPGYGHDHNRGSTISNLINQLLQRWR